MKDELMILLGCGLTALLVTNACSSMYEGGDDDDVDGGRMTRQRRQQSSSRYDCEGYEGGCSSSSYDMPVAPTPASVDYYTEPKTEKNAVVPLMFSSMVKEPYLESDYIEMKDYLSNPDDIKVYDEKTGNIGLPVTDMTQINAGENNKYVYDRTIGTIGFTSTKIGGRFRGQADYIRGDLPVIPDKTGWFQVSSDPANKLMLGAMNVANGIGQTPAPTASAGSGGQHALQKGGKKKESMEKLRKRAEARVNANKPGSQHALSGAGPIPEVTVADIMNAGLLENTSFATSSGVSTSVTPSSM